MSESFLGWGRRRNKKTRKRLIIPFIFILKVFIFVIVVVLICGKKEQFFKSPVGGSGLKRRWLDGSVPEEWIALLRFCITSIRAPTIPAEGAAAEGAESVVSSLCRKTTMRTQDAAQHTLQGLSACSYMFH